MQDKERDLWLIGNRISLLSKELKMGKTTKEQFEVGTLVLAPYQGDHYRAKVMGKGERQTEECVCVLIKENIKYYLCTVPTYIKVVSNQKRNREG